jgi:hypothetical protein
VKYENAEILSSRTLELRDTDIRIVGRGFWGRQTFESTVPLADLRPGVARVWARNSDLYTASLIVAVVVSLLSIAALGLSEHVRVHLWRWAVGAMVVGPILVGLAALLDPRRVEHGLFYYRSGVVALSVSRQGPQSSDFEEFLTRIEAAVRDNTQG